MKLLNKTYIDDGQSFRTEFAVFTSVNLIEADTAGKHRDSMMTIRKHTMSSIRKQSRMSGSGTDFKDSLSGYESPFENPIQLDENNFSPDAEIKVCGEEQSGEIKQ